MNKIVDKIVVIDIMYSYFRVFEYVLNILYFSGSKWKFLIIKLIRLLIYF